MSDDKKKQEQQDAWDNYQEALRKRNGSFLACNFLPGDGDGYSCGY